MRKVDGWQTLATKRSFSQFQKSSPPGGLFPAKYNAIS